MNKKKYIVIKKKSVPDIITDEAIWENVNEAVIDSNSYLWMDNNYCPKVIVKMFHTERNIYVKFKVYETKVKIKHLNFGSDVWKDSCVELFINPFPQTNNNYFNIEINALGVPLIGVGKSNSDKERYYFEEDEIKDWQIVPSIEEAIDGEHGEEYWTLHYKIPKSFFEKYYNQKFEVMNGIVNFYKCGDETEFEHYGAWNKILNDNPNFHLPEYFGEIIFE